MGKPLTDLTGKVFGTLTCLHLEGRSSNRGAIWRLRCECGEECTAIASDLNRGRSNFCKTCRELQAIESPFRGIFGNYKRGAVKRGLSFELPFKKFVSLLNGNCHYCNYPPKQKFKKTGALYGCVYNGVDRVDNSTGYTLDNSVTCCKFCNFAKSKGTREEFYDWITALKHSD